MVKGNEALDFNVKDLAVSGTTKIDEWSATYRLLCKLTPCIPEAYLDFAALSHMLRSFTCTTMYAPIPHEESPYDDSNDSNKLYHRGYLRNGINAFTVVRESFLTYYRQHTWKQSLAHKVSSEKTRAVAVRFAYEGLDIYIGQYVLQELWEPLIEYCV